LKIVFISDTHGFHNQLKDLEGDIIIHAGDISKRGTQKEIIDFINWFKILPFEHKVFIGGNHDFFLEEALDFEIQELIPESIIYLNDSGAQIHGINIWGSPIQPWFHNWAFNRGRGPEIKKHWDLIPNSTDILITHGPPYNILDLTNQNLNVGCEDLLNKVLTVKPKIHAFGHIHEDYGQVDLHGIKFINASVLDDNYKMANQPIELMV